MSTAPEAKPAPNAVSSRRPLSGTRPSRRAWSSASGIDAAPVLPTSRIASTTRAGSRPRRSESESVMRALAWWGTTRSTSATSTPAAPSTSRQQRSIAATARWKTTWPSMRTRRSSWSTTSAPSTSPSARRTEWPRRSGPPGERTAAPAPSPNSAAVLRSSWSVTRDSASAAMTSTCSARPLSMSAAPCSRPARKPVQARLTSQAMAEAAPRRLATRGAAAGMTMSAEAVATRSASRSAPVSPASSSAAWPAVVARSVMVAPGARRRRAAMPVRRRIHSGSTPTRAATSSVAIDVSGRAAPRPVMPAVIRRARARARPAGAMRSSRTRSTDDIDLLQQRRRGGRRGSRDAAWRELGQHAARSGVDVGLHALAGQRGHRVAPAHRAHERLGELVDGVLERRGGRARDDGRRRLLEGRLGEPGAEGLDGGLHLRRVERPGHIEHEGAQALGARVVAGGLEVLAGAREDDLVGRVVVGDGDAVAGGPRGGARPGGAGRREDPCAAAGGARLGHEAAPQDDELEGLVLVDRAGGGQCGELAEGVAGHRDGVDAVGDARPGRQRGAEDGWLGEGGGLIDARERVVAHEVAHGLEEVRARLGDVVAHARGLAALAGEENGGGGGCGHGLHPGGHHAPPPFFPPPPGGADPPGPPA